MDEIGEIWRNSIKFDVGRTAPDDTLTALGLARRTRLCLGRNRVDAPQLPRRGNGHLASGGCLRFTALRLLTILVQ
jgi:hypothetical protein